MVDEAGVVPAENPFATAILVGVDIKLALQWRRQLGRYRRNKNLIKRIEDPRNGSLGMNRVAKTPQPTSVLTKRSSECG
jgi:hypothetical protein